jgi:hypothetical protein
MKKSVFVFFLFLCALFAGLVYCNDGQAQQIDPAAAITKQDTVKTPEALSVMTGKPEEGGIDNRQIMEKLDSLATQNERILEMLRELERKIRVLDGKVSR